MTLIDKGIQALHLAEAQCGLNIRHAVVITQFNLLVVPRAIWKVSHVLRITCYAVTAK